MAFTVIAMASALERKEVIPCLRELLKDPRVSVRNCALFIINRLDYREMADDVAPLVNDPDLTIRVVAERLLAKLKAADPPRK